MIKTGYILQHQLSVFVPALRLAYAGNSLLKFSPDVCTVESTINIHAHIYSTIGCVSFCECRSIAAGEQLKLPKIA